MKVKAIRPYRGHVGGDGLVDVYDISVSPRPYYAVGDKSPIVVSNSKRVALLDVNALISHGATESLRDSNLIRGAQNEDYWFRFMQGHDPVEPKVPKVWDKFVANLQASGINVVKQGPKLNLLAMTNADVDKLAQGRRVTSGDTVSGDEELKPVRGGLFDESATGGHNAGPSNGGWSAFDLPENLLNPVFEDPARRLLGLTKDKLHAVIAGRHPLGGYGTGPAAIKAALEDVDVKAEIQKARHAIDGTRKGARDEAIRKLGFLKQCEKTGIHPSDWMLDKIPVLPPAFRPISMMNNVPLVHDANYLYGDLIESAKNLQGLKKSLGDAGVGDERLGLYKSLQALTGLTGTSNPKLEQKGVKGLLVSIFGAGGPKTGMMQRKLLSNTVDNVGRGVIAPDPNLDLDSIGIPVESALDTYKMFLVRRMRMNGIGIQEALHHVKQRDETAVKYLKEEMQERPVYANRAPVWHRFGFLAMKPQIAPGDTIRVNPTVLQGLGADFDGNCISVHCLIYLQFNSALIDLHEFFPRLVGAAKFVSKSAERCTLSVEIGSVPRLGDFVLDKNGARVYSLPAGLTVFTATPENSGFYTPVTALTVEDGCPVTEVTTAGGHTVTVSRNESLASFDPETGGYRRISPAEALKRSIPLPVSPVSPFHAANSGSLKLGWDPVISAVDKPAEQVFDLQVPETKVFVVDNGLVVYDTMNFHLPTTREAVEEAQRLMPSSNVIASNDLKSVVGAPRQEFLGGLYRATTAKSKRHVRVFATEKAALEAHARGELNADDTVEILHPEHPPSK